MINDLLSLSCIFLIIDYFLRTSVEDLSSKTFAVSPLFELDEADAPVVGVAAAVRDVLVATCAPLAAAF
jgi:hypothetical protein